MKEELDGIEWDLNQLVELMDQLQMTKLENHVISARVGTLRRSIKMAREKTSMASKDAGS